MADCIMCRCDVATTGFVDVGGGPLCPKCMSDLPRMIRVVLDAQRGELELATIEELVGEIVKRGTFRGVILWQKESFKGTCDNEWSWRSKNCEIKEILASITKSLGEVS